MLRGEHLNVNVLLLTVADTYEQSVPHAHIVEMHEMISSTQMFPQAAPAESCQVAVHARGIGCL